MSTCYLPAYACIRWLIVLRALDSCDSHQIVHFRRFFEAIAHFSFCGALSGCTGGRTDEILPVPEEVFYLRRQRGLSDGIRNNSPFSAVLRCV